MVDTTRASESGYINPDLIRDSPTKKGVILDEGEFVESEYNGKKYEKFQLTVEIDGKTKVWSPNKDSVKNIQQEFGKDSKNWIGKLVKFSVGKINGKDTVNGMPIVTMS